MHHHSINLYITTITTTTNTMSNNTDDYVIYLTDAQPWAAVNKAVAAANAAAYSAEINAQWGAVHRVLADDNLCLCYNCGAKGVDGCYDCDCEFLIPFIF
tara:strand:+ start:160 stop:459 length:300 start_codon:yes stop_codon:yes gene_type:complete